jgi:tRNA(adenine34) deaminase
VLLWGGDDCRILEFYVLTTMVLQVDVRLLLLVLMQQVGGLHAAPLSNATMQARFMRRAIELALEGEAAGNDPYGALIADPTRGAIVAEGSNHATHNPIWHGEMSAIANLSALSAASVYAVAGELELYTTAEPCPMCMAAIGWSGFGAVLFGTSIPFIIGQGQAQINVRAAEIAAHTPMHNITLVGGVLANETNPLYVKAAAAARRRAQGRAAEPPAPAAEGEPHEHAAHGRAGHGDAGHTHGKDEAVQLHARLGSVLQEVAAASSSSAQ